MYHELNNVLVALFTAPTLEITKTTSGAHGPVMRQLDVREGEYVVRRMDDGHEDYRGDCPIEAARAVLGG